MPFKFIEDIAIADVAFRATGKNLTELFQSAADAVIESMANPKSIKPVVVKEIKIKNKDASKLLFDFLEEMIYLKDKDAIVFNKAEVKVDEKKMEVTALLTGDTIKPDEQELNQDVKAVTMHYWMVEKKKGIWQATVVLDI
ncbi:MAG: archease [Candidatus Woesearchaeota archaeon]